MQFLNEFHTKGSGWRHGAEGGISRNLSRLIVELEKPNIKMSIEYYYINVKSQSYYHPHRQKQAHTRTTERFPIVSALPDPPKGDPLLESAR
jgi:hypothetical protein